ncbi:TMEM165/GDT1 family protein [Angustibacter aerolatus]
MNLAVALTALVLIVPVELPDKTFVATLVLATRYRPALVWVGTGLAFLVQTVVAVTAGGLLARLPHRPVTLVAALLFVVGGVLLLRSAGQAEEHERESEATFTAKLREGQTGWHAVGASFVVLFLAEWGDLSQLLTAGLVVRTKDPVSVFVGAIVGLLLVSALGCALGRALMKKVRLSTVQRVGGGICLLLAVLTGLQAAGLDLPV